MNANTPVRSACSPYNAGAKNKNENSIGSVIPVKNDTNADPANNDATLAF